MRHDAVPLGLLQPFFVTLPSEDFLQIHFNPSVLDLVLVLAGHRSADVVAVGTQADRLGRPEVATVHTFVSRRPGGRLSNGCSIPGQHVAVARERGGCFHAGPLVMPEASRKLPSAP